ncbi:MAG TPA: hypothetical protein EYQ24_00320 [Bacteroidetes bacterium]|nr:hypothetical protein [Bacteroidota bacterium]HIL57615.1 hypothetical protein [Rhodothermales bacterium]
MFAGLQEYAWLISIVLSFCTLVVWVFYAFLLHRDARHQRHPALFIHQANGHGPDSICLLSNLGREIVHVLGVTVEIETEERTFYKRLTSRQPIALEEYGHARVQDLIKQGPLPSGYFLALGSFGDVLEIPDATDDDEATEEHPGLTDIRSLTIRVAALHAAYPRPIGAMRRFRVDTGRPRPRVVPAMPLTEVLHERRDRRRVQAWLEDWTRRPSLTMSVGRG